LNDFNIEFEMELATEQSRHIEEDDFSK